MLKDLSKLQLNLVTGVIVILATFLGYTYTNSSLVAAAMWPAAGIVVGFYYVFGKKILPSLFIGLIISHLISRFIAIDEEVYITILFSFVFTSSTILEAYLFDRIVKGLSAFSSLTVNRVIIYFSASLGVSLVGAIISVSTILITKQCTDFFLTYSTWVFGDFSGIMVFATPSIFSYLFDKKAIFKSKKTILSGGGYIFFFTAFTYIIFSNSFEYLTFVNFAFLFMIFYFVFSFFFSFRMIIIINAIYVFMYQIFLVDTVNQDNLKIIVFSLNFYLFVLSTIALITKMVIDKQKTSNELLLASSKKLENLVASTNSLFKLSDELMKKDTNFDQSYLISMFDIATKVFDNFDYASCYINKDDQLKYLSGYGYDVEVLNHYFNSLDTFEWSMNDPVLVLEGEETIKSALKDSYLSFSNMYPNIKESIRFNIFISEGIVGGMSFDIMEPSKKSFSQYDIDNFKSYQTLMNSFYEINYLNFKNNNLKNDIVLSLIRTLELYDQYTGGHSEEVAYLAEKISKRLNLSEKEIYDNYWAGIVHDIGKIGVSSEILNKSDKLSLEEYHQIQDHPLFGYQILNKSEDLKYIALLVKHHHEWWNGAGYPDELSKNDIPLGSQILSVCDAVSSMATKRPYTVIKSSEEIIKELKMYKGTQFSPIPTDEMIKFIKEGLLDEFYKDK